MQGPQAVAWPVWVGVIADDVPKQLTFYRDVLGFPVLEQGEGWVWLDAGWPHLLEIVAREDVPQYDSKRFQVAFQVGDIHAARAELVSRGADPVTEIKGGADAAGFWCYFRDAEGNIFGITQRLGPPWPT